MKVTLLEAFTIKLKQRLENEFTLANQIKSLNVARYLALEEYENNL